jgi:hypothetical protein
MYLYLESWIMVLQQHNTYLNKGRPITLNGEVLCKHSHIDDSHDNILIIPHWSCVCHISMLNKHKLSKSMQPPMEHPKILKNVISQSTT